MVVAAPFISALLALAPLVAEAVALPAIKNSLEQRDTNDGYPVLRDLRKRAITCDADSDCDGLTIPANAFAVCLSSICSYRCNEGYAFNFWPSPSCVADGNSLASARILAAVVHSSSSTAAAVKTAAAVSAQADAATTAAVAKTSAAAAVAAATTTVAATTPSRAASASASAASGSAAAATTAAASRTAAATTAATSRAAASNAAQVVTSIVTVTAEPVTITVMATPTAVSAAAVKTVTVTVSVNTGSGSSSSNDSYVYSSGGNVATNVGTSQPLNYTIPLSLRANTSIIAANIAQNNITGFGAQNLSNNTGAIASWFRTNNSADSTNGHSWCYNPYNDSLPGFAPSYKTMVSNYGGDPIKAGEAYCGLEAIFYTPDGRNTTLYVIDAFDDKWVKTPNSVDVVIGAFPELFGTTPASKNDVVMNVKWHFTGNRSTDYIFNNGKNAATASSSSASTSSSSATTTDNAADVAAATSTTKGNFTAAYNGTATYFEQKGIAGNCGQVNLDSSPLVALTTKMYGAGQNCGREVRICATDTSKCVDAVVADSCPTCLDAQDLDLSVAAFKALGHSLSDGVISMVWNYIS
ncbi:BZ3500_MvSof-1268-A1-R1_Chr5-3g08243 [Microbotryum saponariae]|uniref:BZ3500_MvSof-1268-A1-R1_Chr5-3g08243 protein n=1 Tax=Microbotryum saponariae TaxID=289078 RepID=A0A2X0LMI1_9BASI|nr:BZ3500_MvSof-1268-A1-R1_Chr5-3g08243 [Microbotryum saponariae]SDA08351.1 BZ3501_MvSof-1269-A2-R1_Chr5-3g07971 [Microbotryum saponariae]